MGRTRVLKRENLKDTDWLLLHRETDGYGSPRLDGNPAKQFAMKAKDFFSDILDDPVSDTDSSNSGVENTLLRPVMYDAGSPVVNDDNGYVTIEEMHVGTYTLAVTVPGGGLARNVVCTHSKPDALDTLGTVDIVGTDIDDQVITETITPVDVTAVQGTMAFKSITSITGVDWVVDTAADSLIFGWGDLIGLPDYMVFDRILFAMFNNVREATHPALTVSTTVLAENTVDLNSGLDSSTVVIYYLV